MGFIHINDEVDDRFTFPSERRKFIIPTSYPTCDRCNTKFEVLIDRTLKIEMRKIEYQEEQYEENLFSKSFL